MLICDAHADTLYTMQLGEPDLAITYERLKGQPEDVRIQTLSLYTGPRGLVGDEQLIFRELQMLEKLKEEGFHQITDFRDALPGIPNVLLSIEGGEVFHGGIETVDRYYDLGVRLSTLVWNNVCQLAYPAASGDSRGLTAYGRQVVRRMQALGMAVDVSHLNVQGVAEIMEMGGPAPLASHSCAYALCNHPRNLTDDQIRAIFRAGGFVGVNFYHEFLCGKGSADLDAVVDHLAYFCELGGENQVGMGSDFDGISEYPEGLRHGGEVYNLLERLKQRGFGEKLVRGIAGENFKTYMKNFGDKRKEATAEQ